jgi:hypothetical protein
VYVYILLWWQYALSPGTTSCTLAGEALGIVEGLAAHHVLPWVLLTSLGWLCTYVSTNVLRATAFAGHSNGLGYMLVHVYVRTWQSWVQGAYLKAEVILNGSLLQLQ